MAFSCDDGAFARCVARLDSGARHAFERVIQRESKRAVEVRASASRLAAFACFLTLPRTLALIK